jgi:hypothetical protein
VNSSRPSPPPQFLTLGRQDSANEWGTPVLDLHFHLRPQPAANLAHLDGAGIAKANLLTRGRAALDQVKALQAVHPAGSPGSAATT